MLPQRVNPASLRGPVPLGRRPRDLVIKVKYGGTLKRFSASVNGSNLDHNLAALRLKIANAFKLSPDDELILTYTDEDGDIVMLDDDDDLRDAAVSQELNPLRIDVQLKSSSAGAPQPNQQVLNSRSKMSAAMEDQLAQVKSAIDEALKFVPEQVPAVLAKVSHELRSKAASSAPPVRELLDRIAKLMTPKSSMQPTSGLSDSSSGSSSGNPQTVKKDMRNNHASESATVSASHPQHANSSGALGLKSVLVEKTNAQVQQAPGCTSTGVPSVLVGSGGKLLYHKKRTDALSKGKSHAQSIGKPVISSSMPPVPSFAHGGSTLGSANGYMPFGSVGKINGDSSSAFPPPRGPPFSSIPAFETNPRLPSYCSVPTHGLQKAFPPPPAYDYNQFRFSRPSSVNPYGIYQDPYSFGSYSGYGIPQQSIHKWVECDGCGVTPIVGPRFKSTVKHNYDLCSACFYLMGNEAEYTRMDKPLSVSERLRNLNKSQDKRFLQLDCRFVKDLTVPDGTRMAPSTPFRKIWSMRNNGTIVWPYGTHLAWVGGDEFARQSSVKLAIPEAGFPIDGEIDVYVDFVSPTKPGRYISYWRLTSPDLQKFGQQVWVLIEVEQPVQASGDNQTAAIDLNLPADSNPTTSRPSIVQRRPLNFLSLPAEGSTAAWTTDSASDDDDDGLSPWDVLPTWGRKGSISPWDELPTWGRKGSTAVGSVVPPAPAAHEPVHVPQAEPVHVPIAYTQAEPVQVPIAYPKAADERVQASVAYSQAADEPVQVPVAYPHASSAEALGMPAGVPAPEAAPLMEPISTPEPLPAPILDNPLPDETINNNMEEKLLRELADMGFRQVDLNKEVLRQNEYDLQKSVDDLCGFHEWDPLLAELKELI